MTTYRRLDEHTVEAIHIHRSSQSTMNCAQCGMLCRLTDTPTVNGTMRSGNNRCYGCEYANDCLSGRRYKGASFEQHCQRMGYR